jgi:hypothetical protein
VGCFRLLYLFSLTALRSSKGIVVSYAQLRGEAVVLEEHPTAPLGNKRIRGMGQRDRNVVQYKKIKKYTYIYICTHIREGMTLPESRSGLGASLAADSHGFSAPLNYSTQTPHRRQ